MFNFQSTGGWLSELSNLTSRSRLGISSLNSGSLLISSLTRALHFNALADGSARRVTTPKGTFFLKDIPLYMHPNVMNAYSAALLISI